MTPTQHIDWPTNEHLKALIEIDEGKRQLCYDDATGRTISKLSSGGKVTVGVGRNLSDVGLSADEIRYLLTNDIERVCTDLDTRLKWWREQPEHIQYVLINMCFNLGIGGLVGFKNTLYMIKQGQYEEAASNMKHSLWHTQVGDRAVRLEAIVEGDGKW